MTRDTLNRIVFENEGKAYHHPDVIKSLLLHIDDLRDIAEAFLTFLDDVPEEDIEKDTQEWVKGEAQHIMLVLDVDGEEVEAVEQ